MAKKVEAFKCSGTVCSFIDIDETIVRRHEKKFRPWETIEGFVFRVGENYGLLLPKPCERLEYPVVYFNQAMTPFKGFTDSMTFDELRGLYLSREIDFLGNGAFDYFVNRVGRKVVESYDSDNFSKVLQTVEGWRREPIEWRNERKGGRVISGEGICYIDLGKSTRRRDEKRRQLMTN